MAFLKEPTLLSSTEVLKNAVEHKMYFLHCLSHNKSLLILIKVKQGLELEQKTSITLTLMFSQFCKGLCAKTI